MPYLRVTDPQGGSRYVSLHDVTSLGRGKDCDVVLDDGQASRRHAEVRKVGGSYVVTDLKSKNGTYVNGSPVSSWTLREGDLISIGNAQMVFKLQK